MSTSYFDSEQREAVLNAFNLDLKAAVRAALMPPARKAHGMRHYANRSTPCVDPLVNLYDHAAQAR